MVFFGSFNDFLGKVNRRSFGASSLSLHSENLIAKSKSSTPNYVITFIVCNYIRL
jgi:hypothetical protein